jgi:hypothetical protein
MKTAPMILAESFGWDYREVSEYRYQRYTNPNVYSIGDRYFAVHHSKPKHSDIGTEWVEYDDQFGARGTGRTIWVCNSE